MLEPGALTGNSSAASDDAAAVFSPSDSDSVVFSPSNFVEMSKPISQRADNWWFQRVNQYTAWRADGLDFILLIVPSFVVNDCT